MHNWKANYYFKAFSLFEALFTTTIIALLVLLAVPSYRCLIGKTRAQIYASELVTSLEFARTCAIRLGESVTVCGSKNHQTCDGSWSEGIIVTAANGAKILKVLPAVATKNSLSWNEVSDIIFTPNGFANGYQRSFYYCPENATNATVIILNESGVARISGRAPDGKKIPCKIL